MNKKELKTAYKLLTFPMGVYQIRNITNDKIYLGSSKNLNAIWNRERLQLEMGSHPCKSLQNDWKALGEAGFRYEILEEIEQKESDAIVDFGKNLKAIESAYLETLLPYEPKGYHAVSRNI